MKYGYQYPNDLYKFGTTKILEKQIRDEKEDQKREELKQEKI